MATNQKFSGNKFQPCKEGSMLYSVELDISGNVLEI